MPDLLIQEPNFKEPGMIFLIGKLLRSNFKFEPTYFSALGFIEAC